MSLLPRTPINCFLKVSYKRKHSFYNYKQLELRQFSLLLQFSVTLTNSSSLSVALGTAEAKPVFLLLTSIVLKKKNRNNNVLNFYKTLQTFRLMFKQILL